MSDSRDLVLIGIDHNSPTSQYRERYHLSLKRIAEIYNAGLFPDEIMILSTCNRTEFYVAGGWTEEFIWDALQTIYVHEGIDRRHFYLWRGGDVIRHLLELASGLQSMILGETEILGQMESAVQLAAKHGQTPIVLGDLFQKVRKCARRIRVKSGIGTHSTSLTTLIIKELKKEYHDLAKIRALVLGNGVISQKIATALQYRGVPATILTRNRRSQPVGINNLGNIVFGYNNLPELIPMHDVIIAATSAPHLLVRQEHSGLLCGKTVIDLSFPRNIDPFIANNSLCVFWDLEYFGRISRENRELNEQAAASAQVLCYQAAEALNHEFRVECIEQRLAYSV